MKTAKKKIKEATKQHTAPSGSAVLTGAKATNSFLDYFGTVGKF